MGERHDDTGAIVVHPLSSTEAVVFGEPEHLDLLGTTIAKADQPFIDGVCRLLVSAPETYATYERMTGRVLKLTKEGHQLLRQSESMRTTVITGVVRNPGNKLVTGHLTFVNPGNVAALATSLPNLAGGAAMQIQLAQIEKKLDALKKDLDYVIRSHHLKVEADIATSLEILSDVYATSRRHGLVEDDQWDRVANLEASVRSLHRETGRHLHSLAEALDTDGSVAKRVTFLTRALDDDRAQTWLKAHVHAELALTRWECLYLLRQVQHHPEELGVLIDRLDGASLRRRQSLAGLSKRITIFLDTGGTVTTWTDRIRIIQRSKLHSLLGDVTELLNALPPLEDEPGMPEFALVPAAIAAESPTAWNRLVTGTQAVNARAVPVLRMASSQLPLEAIRRRR
jgi:hypothetical protein